MKTKQWLLLTLLGVLLLAVSGTAAAAGFVGEENVYRLPAGETITDDLYVGAEEVIIDGTIEGDLFAAAGYVEINGVVTGDLFAAGAGVTINGVVEDDARIAGAGVTVNGTIGDDLFVAGGGTVPGGFSTPVNLENRTIAQGVFIRSGTTVGGDLFVGGGSGEIAGTVAGDLYAGMGSMTFSASVGGDAELGSDILNVTSDADVAGRLRYSAEQEQSIPAGVAEVVEFNRVVVDSGEPQPTFAENAAQWLIRTLAIVLGFILLGWLLMRFAPGTVSRPAQMLEADTGKSALYGLLAALTLIFIPLLSILLIVLVALFWGGWPAFVLFLALFSVLAMMWIFSPLITGYWLGRLALPQQTPYVAFLSGVAVIVLLSRVPILGWFVSLISFMLALGAILLARQQAGGPPAPVVEKAPKGPQAMPTPGA